MDLVQNNGNSLLYFDANLGIARFIYHHFLPMANLIKTYTNYA